MIYDENYVNIVVWLFPLNNYPFSFSLNVLIYLNI